MTQGGTTANFSGAKLELRVLEHFQDLDYPVFTYKEWEALPSKPKNCIIKNFPYVSIYGTNGRTEFLVYSHGIPTRIECKAQYSNGSVDEKLPYLYLNAQHSFPEDNVIIVVDGDGFKPGAITWLKNSCNEVTNNDKNNKNISVININELSLFF